MSALTKAIIEQLDLPVSVDKRGQPVNLREFLKGKSSTNNVLSLSNLTPKQRVELTIERVKREPDGKIATIGSGIITKEEAIAEIQSQTPLGQTLVEAEQRLINRLIKEAESGRLKGIIND